MCHCGDTSMSSEWYITVSHDTVSSGRSITVTWNITVYVSSGRYMTVTWNSTATVSYEIYITVPCWKALSLHQVGDLSLSHGILQ